MFKPLLYITFFFFVFLCQAQSKREKAFLDSILQLRKLAKNESFDLDSRLDYAKKASELSQKAKIDSLLLASNQYIAFIYMLKDKNKHSIKLNRNNLTFAYKIKDTLNASYITAQLAYCYAALEKNKDSSYFYALKSIDFSKKINRPLKAVYNLILIAKLKNDERDYIGVETYVFRAINLLQTLPENNTTIDNLVEAYNRIGINSKYLKRYDKAIEYHKKALEENNKLTNKTLFQTNYLYNKINLADVYKSIGKYKKGLAIYNDLLKNNSAFFKKDSLTYMTILNNKAQILFLAKNKNTQYTKALFNKAYKIFDSLNANYEIVSGGNDMAEFYFSINKKDSAKVLALRSYSLGKKIKEYYEVSRALITLSKIEKGDKGKNYLYEHIKLNDSLLDIERASRNKFARIQYETDTYKNETKRLATQNILITIIGVISIFILMLIYFIKSQLTKNKILRFEAEQQKTNEEMYTLMIKQQAKIEEGRLQERNRISEELHDGILNKLLGSRLGLEFLTSDEILNNDKYQFYINEIQTVETDIRDISHELKNTKIASEKDFVSIIEGYLNAQSELHYFKYKIKTDDTINWEIPEDIIKVNLYRIIQEAVLNIIKHAKAKMITIDFFVDAKNLNLEITDDGIGFDLKNKIRGIGLKNIQSRIARLNGRFNIESSISKGTKLIIEVPM